MDITIRRTQQVDRLSSPFLSASGSPRKPRLIHAVILLVTAGLSSLATAVLGPTLPRMQEHFANTPHADYLVPLSLTVPMLMMAVLSVFSGMLADRVGRKRILVAGAVSYAICGTAPLWLESLSAILVSRILLGAAEAVVMTVSTMLIGDYFMGTLRAKMMSLHTTFAAISAFVLNLLGGLLGNHGWQRPYWVYGVSLILGVGMAVYLWEPDTGRATAKYNSRNVTSAPITSSVVGVDEFRVRQLVAICIITVVVGLAFLTVPVHLGYLFALIHVTTSSQIGWAFALNSVGVIAGSLTFGWLIGPRVKSIALQITLATGVLAISLVGLSWSTNYQNLSIAAGMCGIGMGLVLPTMATWNMQVLPVSRRGLGIGAFQSSLFLGMFFNPVVVVSLDKWSGSRAASVGWIGVALLTLTGVAALCVLRRHFHKGRKSFLVHDACESQILEPHRISESLRSHADG